MTNIFRIQKSDLPVCAELFVATYNASPWNYAWQLPAAVRCLSEYIDNPFFTGFLICEDDILVGALFGHAKTWWTANQFVIDELFVIPGMQGKGYGSILLKEAETFAIQNGLGLLILSTNKFMPAMGFYQSNGFSKLDEFVFMFKSL